MKHLKLINLVLITVLGITAGIPKVLRVPAEVGFFQAVGIGETVLVLFGLVQIVGGALLIFRKTRRTAAVITAIALGLSVAMLFAAGKTVFGLVSILPVLMAAVVAKEKNPLD